MPTDTFSQDQIQQIRRVIHDEFQEFLASDRYIFHKKIQMLDGRNIIGGKTTGTQIGTESTQKFAFYGATPVVRAAAIASPTGGINADGESRTAIDLIRTALKNFGITA